jgi:isochorismate synthase EntC
VLVGSSPETMVRLENGIATLRPIAGTRPRGRTEQEDRQFADELLKDEKSAPNTLCWSIWGATTWAGSPRSAPCR